MKPDDREERDRARRGEGPGLEGQGRAIPTDRVLRFLDAKSAPPNAPSAQADRLDKAEAAARRSQERTEARRIAAKEEAAAAAEAAKPAEPATEEASAE